MCVFVYVCVFLCVCVCVFLHGNSKRNRSRNMKVEYIIIYENSLDNFNIGHFSLFTQYKLSGPTTQF